MSEKITGAEIKAMREQAGIRPSELAKQAGIPHYRLSKIESGTRKLTETEAALLAAAIHQIIADTISRQAQVQALRPAEAVRTAEAPEAG